MYEDSSDHDSTNSSGQDGEISVTVDGEQYEVETNYDIDKDGQNDTAIVTGDDGTKVAFTDADHDGDADVAVEMDENGNVVGAARYDEASGEWVPVDTNSTGSDTHSTGSDTTGSDSRGSSTGSGGEIKVDVPGESADRSAGQATVDMNEDGKNDTAVVKTDDGDTIGFTDTDGDGEADQMTVIESDGSVSISQHTGEDEWTEVEKGHVDSSGKYVPDSKS
nr:DUF6802 family protein [Kibdelosporangium sp. MJ126-NF4]CEL15902.1 Clumping factor ClfB, fibrinogen binding protein [Kibdelosporangium sp. MJ126-NF4]CTQ93827.1 Clumping factor ClfB, fibrinogen binding protein [Kibdelosporangium sp. MJ126-NF4]